MLVKLSHFPLYTSTCICTTNQNTSKQQDELPCCSVGSSVAKTKDDRWLRKLAMAINLQERRIEQVSILWSILIFALSRLERELCTSCVVSARTFRTTQQPRNTCNRPLCKVRNRHYLLIGDVAFFCCG